MKHKNVPEYSPRWKVEITYNTVSGSVDVTHMIEELWELHDIIEENPTFCAVANINVTHINKDLAEALSDA